MLAHTRDELVRGGCGAFPVSRNQADAGAPVEHVVGVVGEEHVGIGTDFTLDIADTAEYIARDKGNGRFYIPGWDMEGYLRATTETIPAPAGLTNLASQRADLVAAMERRGWGDDRIRRVLGLNWLRVFDDVWSANGVRG